jgi:hypothetical protein
MKKLALVVLALTVSACTDGQLGKVRALGTPGHVACYSGERVIFDGNSTGKISNSRESDGYYFLDAATNKLVEVSGNCVITYN